MNKQNYALEVLINGRPAKEYYKDGRAFIEGREGTQYTLKLRNNSHKRILSVFSVDGIEVIEGKVATEFKGGYIVNPYSSIEVKGYRIDEASVASFIFAKTHKSYSNAVGGASVVQEETLTTPEVVEYKKTTRNNGVIGVRIFEEGIPDNDYSTKYNRSAKTNSRTFYSTTSISIGPTPSTGYNFHTGGNGGNIISFSGLGKIISCSGYLPSSSLIYGTGFAPALNNINSTVNGSFDDEKSRGGARGMKCNSSLPLRNYDPSETINYYSVDNMVTTDVNQLGQLSSVVRTLTADYSTSTVSVAPDFNLGTTWGEKVNDKVKEGSFNPSETFVDLEIYYDSRESLASYGIDFEAVKQIATWPSAFEAKKQFCKVPPGYKY